MACIFQVTIKSHFHPNFTFLYHNQCYALGINKLLKNYENPLRNETIADSLYLLAATLSSERRTAFLIDYIVAQIVDINFMGILTFI